MSKSKRPARGARKQSTVRNSRTTVSGPAQPDRSGRGDVAVSTLVSVRDRMIQSYEDIMKMPI